MAGNSLPSAGGLEAQRDIDGLAEKKATAQFLAGVNTRHGPQPPVYPNTTRSATSPP